jgi:hypothetical protein
VVARLGLVSRLFPVDSILWDKYLGDVVYAAIFYLGLSLVWPRGTIVAKALLTVVYVVAIETFQLTQIPTQLGYSDSLPSASWPTWFWAPGLAGGTCWRTGEAWPA